MGIFDSLFKPNVKEMARTKNIEGLGKCLKHKNLTIRYEAATALGTIGDAGAVEPLSQVLKDKDQEVRRSATEALGKITDLAAIKPLIHALNDDHPTVQEVCGAALARMDVTAVNKTLAERAFKMIKDDPRQWKALTDFLVERVGANEAIKMVRQENIAHIIESIRAHLSDMGITMSLANQ